MEIEEWEYTFIYSSIGYISKEISVIINAESKVINVSLKEDNKQLIELEIVSNTKNKALEILKKAKQTKKQYYQKNYKCIQYSKNSIEKRQFKLKRKDTIKIWDLDTSKTINLKNDVLSSGKFVVDMTTIDCEDLSGSSKTNLESHLKSDDFFSVNKYAEAILTIDPPPFVIIIGKTSFYCAMEH